MLIESVSLCLLYKVVNSLTSITFSDWYNA